MIYQGDIVYIDCDPQSGHEQKGRRPALVISNNIANRRSPFVMVCPITHTPPKNPFFVKVPDGVKVDGYVLCNQARMLDANSRNAAYIDRVDTETLHEAVDIVISLIEFI